LPRKTKILVASRNLQQADVRKKVLEEAGFAVIAAPDIKTVEQACDKHDVRLALIGYSLPPSEKRRVWDYLRKNCPEVPILQLYSKGQADIVEGNIILHEVVKTGDFLPTVLRLLGSKARGAGGA
jgi:DNA-binding response OmpR family regulator